MNNIKLLFGGDLVVSDGSYSKDRIGQNALDLFSSSDLNIVNLESPVTDAGIDERIIKTGPYLKGEEGATAKILKTLKIDLVTLANNHILDYGKKGISDTIAFCAKNRIETVGAGMNLSEARRPFRITIKGKKISIINFAENEWASATKDSAGASPMDLIDNVNQIKQEREFSDFVIVVIHGGHEYYNLPSPRMVKQYRFYADNGANLIVSHHTHCISGNEVYNNVPIYYSLGNLLFTKSSKKKDWYVGLVLEVEINDLYNISTKTHIVGQEKGSFNLNLIEEEKQAVIRNQINGYNNIIQERIKLEEWWDEYTQSQFDKFLYYWSPLSFVKNRYIKGALRRLGFSRLLMNKNGLSLFNNLMRCESHADTTKEVFNKYFKKN